MKTLFHVGLVDFGFFFEIRLFGRTLALIPVDHLWLHDNRQREREIGLFRKERA